MRIQLLPKRDSYNSEPKDLVSFEPVGSDYFPDIEVTVTGSDLVDRILVFDREEFRRACLALGFSIDGPRSGETRNLA